MASTSSVASTFGAIDVTTLVSQLMAVERRPIDTLNAKVTSYQARISSFGTLKGLVSTFQDAAQSISTELAAFSATASDTTVFSATAGSTAVAGTYSIDVTTLAKAQNLAAAGQVDDTAAISAGVSTARFVVGTTSTDIEIAAGATLQDIRTAINDADIGVIATIVNDGSGTPYRLSLAAEDTGLANDIASITIVTGGDAAINDLLAYNPTENAPGVITMDETVTAVDASFSVNGIDIVSASNTISDAIQGVSLTLSKEATATLTVARDTSAISDAVSEFVDAYNALAGQLKSRSAYATGTSAAGSLAGDGTVRVMLDELRSIFRTDATGGTLTSLAQVGISSKADGTLEFDSSTLISAMEDDFSDVTNLFSGATGYATRLDAWATTVVQVGGLIDTRTDNLNTSVDGYNDQIDTLEARMIVLQKQYTTTYTNLNLMLSSMNSTSAYLTQQFSRGTSS